MIGKRLTKDGPIVFNNRYKAEERPEEVQRAAVSETELLGKPLMLDEIVKHLKLRKHLVQVFGKDADENLQIIQCLSLPLPPPESSSVMCM